jgi:hypothetical protein
MTSSKQKQSAVIVSDSSKSAKMEALLKEAAAIGKALHASALIVGQKQTKGSSKPIQQKIGAASTVRSNI